MILTTSIQINNIVSCGFERQIPCKLFGQSKLLWRVYMYHFFFASTYYPSLENSNAYCMKVRMGETFDRRIRRPGEIRCEMEYQRPLL
jgi:hypothetical protein